MNTTKDILRHLMGNNMSEGFLSRETGVPQTTIHRLLTGEIAESKPSTLRPLASYFGVTIAQLQGEEPLRKETKKILQEDLINLIDSMEKFSKRIKKGELRNKFQSKEKYNSWLHEIATVSYKLHGEALLELFPQENS